MSNDQLSVAIINDIFPGEADHSRLRHLLGEAQKLGADVAVLPELPLNSWAPATREPVDHDAEAPQGERYRAMAEASSEAGIALLGGAIVRDPSTGVRHNTAFLFDSAGQELGNYRKTHLPEEEGFWETSHYKPGDEPPQVIDGLALRVGVQVCSDAYRPQGTHLLRALGAEVVFVPRASTPSGYERWKLILRANALTAAVYVISINRPRPEAGVPLGGSSIAIAPDGSVVSEGTESIQVVKLLRSAIDEARCEYPGYLAERADLYARGWQTSAISKPG